MNISRLQQNPHRSQLALLFKFIINFFWSILFRETLIKGAGLNTGPFWILPHVPSYLSLVTSLPKMVSPQDKHVIIKQKLKS